MVADIDRMGALALHVAKIARRRHPQHALPEEVNGYFAEMGRVAVELGNSAQEVVLSRDPEKAARIREEDDAMDDLHRHLFSVLMDREWKHGVAAAVDVRCWAGSTSASPIMPSKWRARVIFQATGSCPRTTTAAPSHSVATWTPEAPGDVVLGSLLGRIRKDLLGVVDLDEPAGFSYGFQVEERGLVANPSGLLHVVGDDDDRVAAGQLVDQVLDAGR